MEAIQKVQDRHKKEQEALQQKHEKEREALRKKHEQELDTLQQERKVLQTMCEALREQVMGDLWGLAPLDAALMSISEEDDHVDENRDTSRVQNKSGKMCSCTFTGCSEKNGKKSHVPGACLNAPAKVGNVCSACTKFKFRKTKVT